VRLDADSPLQLTYCTNIHPADGWTSVFDTLRRYAPALKRRLSPGAPFGLGLRLSAREARELAAGPGLLDDFARFLEDEGLYVALINGFPYGPFHGTPVKAQVYAPDWRDDARVAYTLDLLTILTRLLPEGSEGGISTAPLSYKAWMTGAGEADWERIAANIARVAAEMAATARARGRTIHLDIEPEPDCLIETSDEAIAFFRDHLLPRGTPTLARALGIDADAAREQLREHVQLCFDCCHFAVEYEDPGHALDRLAAAGLGVGRVQLSSALVVTLGADPEEARGALERLRRFADATYLHQVVERSAGGLRHVPDLPEAIASAQQALEGASAAWSPREWRIHFHVPLFTREYAGLGSSQDYVAQVVAAARARGFTRHLEIETYTWDVLPPALKLELGESIAREYEWVLARLGAPGTLR
jgi:sugar phosphate isomerase/epimerase